MDVLIFEPDYGGHRFSAVRTLLDALATIDARLTLHLATTDEAVNRDEFVRQLEAYADRFELHRVPSFRRGRSAMSIAREKVAALSELLGSRSFDHLYLPYADGLAQVLGLMRFNRLFRWPSGLTVEALMMRGSYAYPGGSRLAHWANLRMVRLAGFDRLHLIDPLAYEHVKNHAPGLAKICTLMPDPAPMGGDTSRRDARCALGIPPDGRYLGCIGAIDERKGVDLLVRAFLAAQLEPDDRLLLVGRQSTVLRDLLDRSDRSRIVALDRYVSDRELELATSAMDLMVTPYPDFVGSASIVLRAAAAGRMCLGADTGWMNYMIPKFGLGSVCTVRDAKAFRAAIEASLPRSTSFTLGPAGERLIRYYGRDNVHAHWTALLRARLGVRGPEPLLLWP